MKITQFFIDNKKFSTLCLIMVVIAGVMAMVTSPRQDSPNVDFNILTIVTVYPGASPEDVEINVTDKLEDELEQVNNIEETVSYSVEGMSWIYVTIDPDADDSDKVIQDVRSAVDRVSDFPPEVEDRPQIVEIKSSDFPVLEVAVASKTIPEFELRKIVRDMEADFRAIGDVGAIQKMGYRKREVQIHGDLDKMAREHVSFGELIAAINARNIRVSGGTLDSYSDTKKIVTFSEFDKVMDVQDVIIRSNYSGKFVKVHDVATVTDSFTKRSVIHKTNGINSINMIVQRSGNSDVLDLSREIRQVVEKYQGIYKDKGVDIRIVVDFSYYTKALLNIVRNNALIGFCLVVTALFLFLNFHTAFWVGVGIPLSILASFILFPLFDISTNQITLITIIMVLGMLVDDAIVIAENITRHQEEGMDFKKAALYGTKEMIRPVMATILTTILCFSPILFMTGILGRWIYSIPVVVIITLLMSLVESVTLLPAHLSMRKMKVGGNGRRQWIDKLRDKYGKLLFFLLKRKKRSLASIIAIFVVVGSLFGSGVKFELFPTEDFDLFYVVMESPTGTSLEEMSDLVSKVEREVESISPKLMFNFTTEVGRHRTNEAASNPSLHENWALISVYLYPASQRDIRSESIIEKLKKQVKGISGFEKLDVREMQDGPPVGAPVQLRIVSDNFAKCTQYEKEIMDFLKTIDGVKDIETSNLDGKKEIRLRPDYQYMAKLGITASDLARTIRMAYDGVVATSVRREGEEIDFRVKLSGAQNTQVEKIKSLQLLNSQQKLITIGKFVSFEHGVSKQAIDHFNGKRSITVKAQIDHLVTTSKAANKLIRDKFEKRINNDSGVSLVFGGMEKETDQSLNNFMVAFVCSVIGIYFVLVILMNSYSQPFLIMVAIPFGVVGVLVAFYLHGISMSFIGLVGTLGMIGVVVNDSLVMVTHLNDLRDEHHRVTKELIVEGAKTRLRPVLLTTITTLLGLLPTVYGWGGSEPFIVPMVLAMSFGLLFATVITLVMIPLLYTFVKEPAV